MPLLPPDEFDASVEDDADLRGLMGPVEIGNMEIGNMEIGYLAPASDRSEIGVEDDFEADTIDAYEIGNAEIGNAEIGNAEIGNMEIGADDDDGYTAAHDGMVYQSEIGNMEIGNMEIGAYEEAMQRVEIGAAVKATIQKARDNRAPSPAMKAVEPEAPIEEDEGKECIEDVCFGAAITCGANVFPITTKLIQRFSGEGGEPRFVRVDTEKSYAAFRESASPELAALKERVRELSDALARHQADPYAHQADADLAEEAEEVEAIGAEVVAAEAGKKIDLWLPKWAEGKINAWREGDFVCCSMRLPGADGEVRIATSMTPMVKYIEEMSRAASEANVNGADIVGVLPAMGCCLGAGTLVKQMASAAPAILSKPEARAGQPFVCRIEPKAKPSLAAMIALWDQCCAGNKQACAEWNALAKAANKGGAKPLAKAMNEAIACCQKVSA